jgi:hypothetical protein
MTRKCETCSGSSGSFPLLAEGFSRRRFLQIAGTGVVASWFADVLNPNLLAATTGVAPFLQNSARNCILVFLAGAPSQVDTWDLKEGSWTPSAFEPTPYGEIRFPRGLLPETADHLDKLAFVRAGLAWAAVHSLAQTWAQISRNPTGALGRISPHIGAVVALEMQQRRAESDVLPGFISLNSGNIVGSGYLSARYAPFKVTPSDEGLVALTHPDGAGRLASRWNLLGKLDVDRSSGALGKTAVDMSDFYDQAKTLVDSPEIAGLFSFTAEESERYGGSPFGNSMILAKQLIGANRGARVIQVNMGGWDHHNNIYGAAGQSLLSQGAQFDPAFGSLLTDLAATPGVESGKALLDETLVVVLAEFGRTVGALNNQGGRDHLLRMSHVFAGGGVRGGRALGKTNSLGDQVLEYGWRGNRDVRPEDVTATIYSALGIDYTITRNDDPLGRGFEYVPYANQGLYEPVSDLFV